jgi:hypothetical protein
VQRRADGQAGVARIDGDEHLVEEPATLRDRVDRGVIEEAAGEAQVARRGPLADLREQIEKDFADPRLERRGQRGARRLVTAAVVGEPAGEARLEAIVDGERAVVAGHERVDTAVAGVGTQPGQRFEALVAGLGAEAKRACGPRVDVDEAVARPGPLDTRDRTAATLPHAHLRGGMIAHDNGGIGEG